MLESVYIGMTGLMGYSQGLRVIANNTANINTPGFKSSLLQFADLFSSGGGYSGGAPGSGAGQSGHGLGTGSTVLNFRQGELRQTNNDLDLAIDGQGLFALRDADGKLHYTRAGQFQFNANGILVNRTDGAKVMGGGAKGNLTEMSIASLRTTPGKATANISFSGNLSSATADQTINGITVFDAVGGEHSLSAKFVNAGSGVWDVTLMDGTTAVGNGKLTFIDGSPTPASAKIAVTYSPAGLSAIPLTLDFSVGVTSFASGNLSTLAVADQDGYAPAGLTKASFDSTGTLVLTYANGQTVKGSRLALGRFDSIDAVTAVGNNEFDAVISGAWHLGFAGTEAFGSINSGMVEVSNVDLSQEFSDLVIMQRGYQASSQIVSTANDMLQELFAMKGK